MICLTLDELIHAVKFVFSKGIRVSCDSFGKLICKRVCLNEKYTWRISKKLIDEWWNNDATHLIQGERKNSSKYIL